MISTFLQSAGNVIDFNAGPIYSIAYPLHSLMRYVILIFIIWALIAAAKGQRAEIWQSKVKRPAFFTMLAVDIQLLLGLYLWVVRLLHDTQNFEKIKILVKAPVERAIMIEHALIMFIAIVMIHIGYAKAKKATTDLLKSKRIFNFYLIALILILAGIILVMVSDKSRGFLPNF